ESEGNLARVEDILAELRPQVRRLAAQAEQQATRDEAGEALARVILDSAAWRWHESASRSAAATERRSSARIAADGALAALTAAEADAARVSSALAGRGDFVRARRAEHDAAIAALMDVQLRAGRARAEVAGFERDAERIAAELLTVGADIERER